MEAASAWQWWNFYAAQVPHDKAPLRINWDETAICLFQGGGRGSVFLAKQDQTEQNVPLGKQRSYLTHVAFVCDDVHLQAVLPQVLIGNEKTLPAKQLAALRARLPPRFHLLREKSAWVNAELCVQIVGWLHAALAPYMGSHQPVLLLDGHSTHINRRVFTACVRARIWPVIVPAKMTWLMQPLDTHAFLRFKVHIQQAYQAASVRALDGDVSLTEFIDCVHAAVREVIDAGQWADAFDADGFGIGQAGMSDRVVKKLQLALPLNIGSDRPTLLQLQSCFPKRAYVPVASIWRPFATPAAASTSADHTAGAWGAAPPDASSAPPAVWVPRRSARLAGAAGLATAKASGASASSSASAPVAMPKAAAAGPLSKAAMPIGPLTRARARAARGRP